ncbi:chemotaxis protein CheA, partial [Azoarcus sp. TTM-91]|nr:chemotaxis protein CheA [Azoarcus sp. TTM-91]
ECRDHIEDLVGRALEDDGGEAVLAPHGDALLARLQVALGEAAAGEAAAGVAAGEPAAACAAASPPVPAEAMLERVQADTWHLSLRFAPGVLR